MPSTDRELLIELYRAAVEAAEPGRALEAALDSADLPRSERIWILALGKAAQPLAAAAAGWLIARGVDPVGGLVIAPEPAAAPHPELPVVVGDHPLPGPASMRAAESLEDVVRRVQPSDEVWVLLSGGTTSLIAAPVRGISAGELRQIFEVLLRSGLEIGDVNRVRKRVSRWGGGRLAVVLAHATVRVFALSDVPGDDFASIGSGPCSPDPTTAARLRATLAERELLGRLPASFLDLLDRTERRMVPETPKPGEPAFRDVHEVIIAGNRLAVFAAATAAERAGLRVRRKRKPLRGEAVRCGERIGRRILEDILAQPQPGDGPTDPVATCYLCGGETTVTIGQDEAGLGGRCQELALAAARAIDGAAGATITLLAAGTDGRDGPTDAAGAIIDSRTWQRIRTAGREPEHDLDGHDAYNALAAADALFRTGPTRTNVNDVIFAIARAGSDTH